MHAASRRVEPDAGGSVEHARKVARDEATQRKGEVPAARRELAHVCVQARRETFARLQQRVDDVTEQRRPGELSDNAIEGGTFLGLERPPEPGLPERTEHLDALAQMFVSDVRARREVKRVDTGLTTRRETDRRQPEEASEWLVLALRVEDRDRSAEQGRLGPTEELRDSRLPASHFAEDKQVRVRDEPRRVRTKRVEGERGTASRVEAEDRAVVEASPGLEEVAAREVSCRRAMWEDREGHRHPPWSRTTPSGSVATRPWAWRP